MDLGISGLASGFDWKNLVEQLADVERVPQTRLRVEQSTLDQRKIAYGSISTQFGVLKNRVDALKDPTLFESRLATTGDSEVASASASAGSALGTYTFAITQLATTSLQQGGSNAGLKLNSTNDVSSLVLSGAGFANPVTAGTFTVNGKQVTIATTDTLAAVFTKISTATGGAVTGAYNNATDKITLSGTGAIVLGSATDSSNFLRIAKLENNGTNTIASAVALGTIKQTATLNEGNFTTAISDGGSGNGQFKINGVAIAFNASTDTTADVIARINNSTAGVVAAYDAVNDRFQLTNKSTGDVGIALEDVTGNFLAGTGLSSGSLSRGHNLLYTINGGAQLSHHSNTITDESSSLTGLTVTALKEGSTTIQTTSDTSKITAAVKDFIGEYNKSQSLIDSHTASTTDAKGKVTAGILAGENEANELSSKLRGLANSVVSGLSGSVSQLVQHKQTQSKTHQVAFHALECLQLCALWQHSSESGGTFCADAAGRALYRGGRASRHQWPTVGHWVVCWDVRCRSRLQRLQRAAAARMVALQRSVYWLRADAGATALLATTLMRHLDPTDDALWFYPLASAAHLSIVVGAALPVLPVASGAWPDRSHAAAVGQRALP